MQTDQLPSNILKILSGEGSTSLAQKFIQQLNVGQFLQGRVVQVFSGGKSQIDFGGHKLIVEGKLSFNAGQSLTAQVKQLTPVPEFKLAHPTDAVTRDVLAKTANDHSGRGVKQEVTLSLRPSAPISTFAKNNLEFLKLSEGRVYQVPVKQVVNPESVVTQLNNRSFVVKTDGLQPLRPGDQIQVTAQAAKNGLLQLTQTNDPVIRRVNPEILKPYLSTRQPIGKIINNLKTVLKEVIPGSELFKTAGKEALARLGQTIQALTPGTEKIPSSQQIKEQVNLSGIDYEGKVRQFLAKGLSPESAKGLELSRDLKGQLLDIIQKLDNQGMQKGASSTQSQLIKDTIQVFRQAVDNIELNQLTNQLAKQEGQPLILQIPNPYTTGDPTIQLYVRPSQDEENGNKGNNKKDFHLVFLLNLTKLGNLRVDSQIAKTQLSVKMTVENQSIANFIGTHARDFETRLEELGFKTDLTCCVQESIDMKPFRDLPEILKNQNSQLVDVTT